MHRSANSTWQSDVAGNTPITAGALENIEYVLDSTASTLVYANGQYPPRPDPVHYPAGSVHYVGPAQPSTWLVGDRWTDTTGN